MSDPRLLELRDVTVAYRDGWRRPAHEVLHGISTAVDRGETVAIVGESGSGKTTMARAVLGMVPISSGSIRFDGHEIGRQPNDHRQPVRRGMAVVYQDPYRSLSPTRTVRQTLAEPLQVSAPTAEPAALDRTIVSMLERVGIAADALGRYPSEFSGGQRQRIAIARALVSEPSLLLCDEPLSALDVSVQAQVLNLLVDLQGEFGFGCLFISHNIVVVRHFAQRVVVFHDGVVVEEGPATEICERPTHDYTRSLIEAVPDLDPDVQAARRRERRTIGSAR
ncbi:MAG: ATP-binding cassette domain-containing protein [Acidimicrobiales bacterium]